MENRYRPAAARTTTNALRASANRDVAFTYREDYDIVQFALTWTSFGNLANEHIWVEFGMNPARYVDRLAEALDGPIARTLDPGALQELRRFVATKLHERHMTTRQP